MNPIHYAVTVCPQCRYAAFADGWAGLSDEERRHLQADSEGREEAAGGIDFAGERDAEAASIAYRLALRCYDLREADARRRAGILQRLGWIAREQADDESEQRYLALARDDYLQAFQRDGRVSEDAAVTLSYLLGDLSLRLGLIEEAIRWFDATLRMEHAKGHPEIIRRTRERWKEARELSRDERAAP